MKQKEKDAIRKEVAKEVVNEIAKHMNGGFAKGVHNKVHKNYIEEGYFYEKQFSNYFRKYEEISNVKLLFKDHVGVIYFDQVKTEINNCHDDGNTYYISPVRVPFYIDGKTHYHNVDAMIIENNTIKVVELKKNVTNLDSTNVKGKCNYLNDIQNIIGSEWKVEKILVSIESVSHDKLMKKCKLTEDYKNASDFELLTGKEYQIKYNIDSELFKTLNKKDTLTEDMQAMYFEVIKTVSEKYA
jgi:hypothetical protein